MLHIKKFYGINITKGIDSIQPDRKVFFKTTKEGNDSIKRKLERMTQPLWQIDASII